MAKIIYITGGQRSGKSSYAQRLAESLSPKPIYLATAKCWDEEFGERIARHKRDRGERWDTIEELIHISEHILTGRVVMLDCITLWLTNIFCEQEYDRDRSLAFAKQEWRRFTAQEATIIAVSNEIGQGVIPIESSTRAFVDLQGWMNQYIAATADEAYTLISGIPLKLK